VWILLKKYWDCLSNGTVHSLLTVDCLMCREERQQWLNIQHSHHRVHSDRWCCYHSCCNTCDSCHQTTGHYETYVYTPSSARYHVKPNLLYLHCTVYIENVHFFHFATKNWTVYAVFCRSLQFVSFLMHVKDYDDDDDYGNDDGLNSSNELVTSFQVIVFTLTVKFSDRHISVSSYPNAVLCY